MPFSINSIKSKTPFELIHCDVLGPFFFISSSLKLIIFLIFVDDYTKFTWLCLMKIKSETKMPLCFFLVLVKNQLNVVIKMVSPDNETKFLVKDLQQFFFSR